MHWLKGVLIEFPWRHHRIGNNIFSNNGTAHNIVKENLKQFLKFAGFGLSFTFDNTYYWQLDGAAMGSPLGPILTNAFLVYYVTILFFVINLIQFTLYYIIALVLLPLINKYIMRQMRQQILTDVHWQMHETVYKKNMPLRPLKILSIKNNSILTFQCSEVFSQGMTTKFHKKTYHSFLLPPAFLGLSPKVFIYLPGRTTSQTPPTPYPFTHQQAHVKVHIF